jgi:hypothetical protein
MHLVVLPRGWVMVGVCEEKDGSLFMADASVVRRWGTTKGLPGLANSGPLKDTVLDGKCEMEFPLSAVIAKMKCNAKAWKKY